MKLFMSQVIPAFPPQTSPRALVLDFGGVISRTLFETHDLSEAALGLPPGTLTWRGPFAPEADPLWQAMQADQITERDYWLARTRSVGALVGEEWSDMQTFVQRARGADVAAVIRPEAVAAVHQAKAAGCKLAILSNELDLFYGASFRERLPLLQLFDVVIDATYTGILKPDPRAYALCTDALGVPARDCVFVDDQSRNVLGAQKQGWHTVHFDVTDPAASYARALELLMS
jgi:putative hydrolase of the HAD superfamily